MGSELEVMAQVEQRYRESVAYPRAARRAQIEREIALIERARGKAVRRNPVSEWLGNRLVNLGDRLAAAGRRLTSASMSTTVSGS